MEVSDRREDANTFSDSYVLLHRWSSKEETSESSLDWRDHRSMRFLTKPVNLQTIIPIFAFRTCQIFWFSRFAYWLFELRVLKWKPVFFPFGPQICISVSERSRGKLGMKFASVQLKKLATALIVFRFREKQNTERLRRSNVFYTPFTSPQWKVSSVFGTGRSMNSISWKRWKLRKKKNWIAWNVEKL